MVTQGLVVVLQRSRRLSVLIVKYRTSLSVINNSYNCVVNLLMFGEPFVDGSMPNSKPHSVAISIIESVYCEYI